MIYIQHDTTNDKQVTKVGGTNKANRVIKIANQRAKLEEVFMKQAKASCKIETNVQSKLNRQSKRLAYRMAKKLK